MRRWAESALRTVLGGPAPGGAAVGGSASPLTEPVARMVTEIGEVVGGLAHTVGQPAEGLERDVAVDAFNIAAAVIDSDGRHTDDELWALTGTFGPLLGTSMSLAGPSQVRESGIVAGKRQWLDRPSTLFDILVAHDARDGTRTAWRYYELAMRIAHTAASLDAMPSPDELAALDRFRTTLLDAMRRAPAPVTPAVSGGVEAAATPPPNELPPPRPLAELLEELDRLVGLEPVKAEVHRVADLLQVMRLREERGLPATGGSRHLVFTGNPGTGKTTVARLLAQIYRTLGVVEKGHLVETDRSGLVAGYVGQTAIKVKGAVDSALGGLLLVDEAYSLVRGTESDFGREAIDMLVKLMEDHRDDLVVIVAGYPDEMGTFIDANPGLRSRFPRTIHFPDYTTDELVRIFAGMCAKAHYEPTAEALEAVRSVLDAVPRDKGFGNARVARNLFEAALAHQASRIVDLTEAGRHLSDEELVALLPEDIEGHVA